MSVHRYDRKEDRWSHDGAWRHLLANKPRFLVDGLVFEPSDDDFRRRNEDDAWVWYVACWRLVEGFSTPSEAPSRVPDPVGLWHGPRGLIQVPYSWESWGQPDGQRACGFVLINEVMPHSTAPRRVETIVVKHRILIDHADERRAKDTRLTRLMEAVDAEVAKHPDATFDAKHNFDGAVAFLRERGITVDLVEG
jgi:hypothetical protein